MGKKRDFKTTLEHWKFKYKLSILNEKTLEEVLRIRLSRLTVFIYGSLALVVVFFLMSALILFSPLKYYLPGFSDYSLRSELSHNMAKVNSLSSLLQKQTLQLQTTKNLIAGTLSADSIPKQKDISVEKYRELVEKKSDREQQFIENFQKNIVSNTITPTVANNAAKQNFAVPLAGTAAASYGEKGDNAVKFTGNNREVLAVAKGIVMSADLTVGNRYTVYIQHPDGYVSVYKNLSAVFKQAGSTVSTGDVIGQIDAENDKQYLIFEIWQNSIRIDPRTVMDIK